MWQRLGSRPIEALIDLPPMTDPVWRATMDVLTMATGRRISSTRTCISSSVARAANLSLEHGNSDGSSLAYVLLGEILGPRFGNYDAAFRFGKLGLRPGGAARPAALQGARLLLLRADGQRLDEARPQQHRAVAARLRGGAADRRLPARRTCATPRSRSCSLTGDPLGEVRAQAEDGARVRPEGEVRPGRGHPRRAAQAHPAAPGIDARFSRLRRRRLRRGGVERRFEGDPSLASRRLVLDPQAAGAFLAGTTPRPSRPRRKRERFLWIAMSFPEIAEHHFYAALAHAAAHDEAPADERPEHLRGARRAPPAARDLGRNCPENFENRAALVGAELARLHGDASEAERVRGGDPLGARQRLRPQRGDRLRDGGALLPRARPRPDRRHLPARGARPLSPLGRRGQGAAARAAPPAAGRAQAARPAATVALRPEQLDLLSVVKASQTISGRDGPRAAVAHAAAGSCSRQGGARRALVLLAGEGALEVAAEAAPRSAAARADAADGPRIPLAARVRAADPRSGCSSTTRPRTRAASPATRTWRAPVPARCCACPSAAGGGRRAPLPGERLVPGAFTPERLLALELLAAQAAISLENALPPRARARRPRGGRGGRAARVLLGEATALMSSTARRRRSVRRADPAVRRARSPTGR